MAYSSSPYCDGLEVLPPERSEKASGECHSAFVAWRKWKKDSSLMVQGVSLGCACVRREPGGPRVWCQGEWVWRMRASDL